MLRMLPTSLRSLRLACAFALLVTVASVHDSAMAQGLLGRPSPPQPQQKQGLQYFAGAWRFSWAGRESAITAGPRSGTITFTMPSGATVMRMETQGAVDGGAAYQESGTLEWDDAKKALTIHERIAAGVDVRSVGDWTSPIAINAESAPMTVKGQNLRLRRFYSILSATSFTIVEELSTNGGPFVRLGKGDFTKQ